MSTAGFGVSPVVNVSVPRLAQEATSPERPSLLACTQCRGKHKKCNGATPSCLRCKEDELPCSYVQSRRGGKRKALVAPAAANQPPAQRPCIRTPTTGELATADYNAWSDEWLEQTVLESIPSDVPNRLNPEPLGTSVAPHHPVSPTLTSDNFQLASTSPEYVPVDVDVRVLDERLIGLYYEFFHQTHPILMPERVFVDSTCPDYLRSVMKFIGAHYVSSSSRQSLRATASAELIRSQEKSPAMVQAKLLYSIMLRANNEGKESETMLLSAMELAIALGMDKKGFADAVQQQQPVEAESFRRTWWELYINECLTDLLWRIPDTIDRNTDCDVSMPCEESVYAEATQIPVPFTVDQFDARLFASDDKKFSSFTYRIEAARLLNRVSKVCYASRVPRDKIQAVDNALMSWSHHIPGEKRLVIDDYGQIDEMLLQAHIMIQCANIVLNLPRSCLPANTSFLDTTLASTRAWRPAMAISTPQIHAVKTIEASKHLSNLLSLCSSMQKHSPTIIPSMVLCGMVQQSAYRYHMGDRDCLEQHRDRVTLIIGLLKSVDGLWESAKVAQQQLKRIAADTFWPQTVPASSNLSGSHDLQVGIRHSIAEELSWVSFLNMQDFSWMSPAT